MARNFYLFVFLTICSLLCVSALEEGGNSAEKKEVNLVEVDQILHLPSEGDSKSQAIPWAKNPIQIHSFRVPRRPIRGKAEEEMEHHPNLQQGERRLRLGRPGGCHGKFKHFVMPREDLREHRHVHAHAHPFSFPRIEDLRGDGMPASRSFHFNHNSQRDSAGFEMESRHRERESEGEMGKTVEEKRRERLTARVRELMKGGDFILVSTPPTGD